jgi:hypothetical protein
MMVSGKLFCGIMYSNLALYNQAIAALTQKYGELEKVSEEFEFGFTDYYQKEFGTNLKKRFVIFRLPIIRDALPDIKNFTCCLERQLGSDSGRKVNIDPGYITLNNVVVASTKEFPSRIYLRDGIYGDIQLILKRDEVLAQPFTFADYKAHQDFFLVARKLVPRQ